MNAFLEQQAIRFIETRLEDGADWLEIQNELADEDRFLPLFPSLDTDDGADLTDIAYAQELIRQAEENLGWHGADEPDIDDDPDRFPGYDERV